MMRPKLFQVLPQDDFTVILFYDNGEIKRYDCNWIRFESGVFRQIQELPRFKDLCTIMNGTLAWDISEKRDPYNCIDLCPDTVYQDSVKINKEYIQESA
jgi:hypothetical protein